MSAEIKIGNNKALLNQKCICHYSFSHNNLLSDLIGVHCSYEEQKSTGAGNNEDIMVTNLTNAILAAEDHLGISKTLIG